MLISHQAFVDLPLQKAKGRPVRVNEQEVVRYQSRSYYASHVPPPCTCGLQGMLALLLCSGSQGYHVAENQLQGYRAISLTRSKRDGPLPWAEKQRITIPLGFYGVPRI